MAPSSIELSTLILYHLFPQLEPSNPEAFFDKPITVWVDESANINTTIGGHITPKWGQAAMTLQMDMNAVNQAFKKSDEKDIGSRLVEAMATSLFDQIHKKLDRLQLNERQRTLLGMLIEKDKGDIQHLLRSLADSPVETIIDNDASKVLH